MNKKWLCLTLALLLFPTIAAGGEYADLENSISLKGGWHFLQDNKYSDYWVRDAKNLNGLWGAISYQRRWGRFMALEADLGVFSGKTDDHNIIYLYDYSFAQVNSIFLSPTVKGIIPLGDHFSIYGGLGPDLYYSEAKWRYSYPTTGFLKTKDTALTWGAHGLLGFEALVMGDPASQGWLDLPVSFFLEYKYAWVIWKKFNKKALRSLGLTSSPDDLNIGGHFPTVGLRWHF
ncbi:MAG: hypothetical protein V1816_15610 [Pseudomonadota bacterium]